MRKAKTVFLVLFLLDSIAHLAAEFIQDQSLIYITKPLLMPLLAISTWLSFGSHYPRAARLVIIGLLFSFVGDLLLMFTPVRPNLFVFGLISFLLAHISYIASFVSIASIQKGFVLHHLWLIVPFLLYLVSFNLYLFDGVPGDLKIPVLIYSGIIMTMSICALNLRGFISNTAFYWIFVGSLFFLASDSLLAAGKFKGLVTPVGFDLSILIMITYLAGQFGISKGIVIATHAH